MSADVAESFVLEIGYRFGRGFELGSSAFNQTLMTILRLNVSSSIFARRTDSIVGQLFLASGIEPPSRNCCLEESLAESSRSVAGRRYSGTVETSSLANFNCPLTSNVLLRSLGHPNIPL